MDEGQITDRNRGAALFQEDDDHTLQVRNRGGRTANEEFKGEEAYPREGADIKKVTVVESYLAGENDLPYQYTGTYPSRSVDLEIEDQYRQRYGSVRPQAYVVPDHWDFVIRPVDERLEVIEKPQTIPRDVLRR